MEELWVGAAGYEGRYEISSHRRVRSLKRRLLRSDGIYRTVQSKYLFTDNDIVGLGKGYGKGGTSKGVTSLMIQSFYSHLDPEEYDFVVKGPRTQATLDDIDVIHKEFRWPE